MVAPRKYKYVYNPQASESSIKYKEYISRLTVLNSWKMSNSNVKLSTRFSNNDEQDDSLRVKSRGRENTFTASVVNKSFMSNASDIEGEGETKNKKFKYIDNIDLGITNKK